MRVLVCGGRTFGIVPTPLTTPEVDQTALWEKAHAERDLLTKVLNELHSTDSSGAIDTIIHGGAKGADTLANHWAYRHHVDIFVFNPRSRAKGSSGGASRNARMIALGQPDLVLAFPGGVGTADVIGKAKEAGIPIRVIVENEGL